ncbi:helix-hairpin-helix protein [Allonocardiopsis opalescens]|uniref:Helix-hairpin-helix protein n=1 Tax=Allonocardiopsis opalescens TaxID=1144618 RepID=A0A2T0QDC1_9ACTN|nr:helix-hairpin-helix protein [Allonocardiopsis opalescens]
MRKAALAMPEAEEGTHFGMPSFSVRGKGFAVLDRRDAVLLHLPAEAVERVLAEYPTGERLERRGTLLGVRLPLADIDGQRLNGLAAEAWRHRAPKRLVAAYDEAERAAGRPGGDLPAIGRPATSALYTAGITSLEQVAERSEAELRALHGVGPKAIRILREALEASGRSLR